MDHLFEVGKSYKNRDGRYEVVAIAESKMRIRYESGREVEVTIAVQERIWQTMKDEAAVLKPDVKPAKSAGKKGNVWTSRGHAFTGLVETDFKDDVAGTDWRRRPSLGGLVALQLSEATSQFFQSYGVSRRPSVHVYLPDYYDANDAIPFAKNMLRLSSGGAQYGFYVERAGSGHEMGKSWHWWPFLQAMKNEQLLEQLEEAMGEHNLYWLLQVEEGAGTNWSVHREIKVQAGAPLLWEENEAAEQIDWAEFLRRLHAVPAEQWLNVHLCAWMDKETAVAAGPDFAEQVSRVFRAVLPLYMATLGI